MPSIVESRDPSPRIAAARRIPPRPVRAGGSAWGRGLCGASQSDSVARVLACESPDGAVSIMLAEHDLARLSAMVVDVAGMP